MFVVNNMEWLAEIALISLVIAIIVIVVCPIKAEEIKHPILSKVAKVIPATSLIITVVSLALIPIGTKIVSEMDWKEDKDPVTVETIISLSNNNLVQGKIYGKKGYIDQTEYYQYMVTLSDGGMIANKVPADKTTIYYDQKPRVEWYTKTRGWLCFTQKETFWKLYIPEGSIVEEYKIDLGK